MCPRHPHLFRPCYLMPFSLSDAALSQEGQPNDPPVVRMCVMPSWCSLRRSLPLPIPEEGQLVLCLLIPPRDPIEGWSMHHPHSDPPAGGFSTPAGEGTVYLVWCPNSALGHSSPSHTVPSRTGPLSPLALRGQLLSQGIRDKFFLSWDT